MEIPAGKRCEGCPFCVVMNGGGLDRGHCLNAQWPEENLWSLMERLPSCLSAYPHGATVTITPKEAS